MAATTKNEKNEETPLVDNEVSENMQQLSDAYGSAYHATFTKPPISNREFLTDYEPLKLSSFRVFFLQRGTIIKDPVLAFEQLLITLIFLACAAPVWWHFRSQMDDAASSAFKGESVKKWIREQEGKMRAFAMIMTNLAAFLLSFYTSIVVARWWAMRTVGVGGIKAAVVDIELLLYQNVTKDKEVLSAVRRYGRASLMLIFLWRRGDIKDLKRELTRTVTTDGKVVAEPILTDHECEQLLKWNHCLHETIWAWQSAIISMLKKEGLIQSDQLYTLLLEKCTAGRAAVQCIHTHLAVRIPMQYVHLLGLLVKMHNLVLAIIMGLLFGAALRQGEVITCVQLFGRTLILPFLFNAILLINAELSDPFNGSEGDFPVPIYQAALEKDSCGMISATENMPSWLDKRTKAVV